MDLSKEFILQCEKAVDIQKEWKPKLIDIVKGDFIGFIKEVESDYALERLTGDNENFGKYAWYEKKELFWIPRQDQLQEMLKWEEDGKYGVVLIDAFYKFAKSSCDTSPFNSNNHITWEQLWLAFVMKEKFLKEWFADKEDWRER